MEDQRIVELYWARSEDAISQTAEKYGAYCHSISYHILENEQDAQECVNDTYLQAWNTIPPQRPNRLAAFLGRITRNLSLNRYAYYTAEKRGGGQTALALCELEEAIPAPATVEQAAEEKRLVRAINSFLYAQPERKRYLFVRRYWHLDSIGKIAADCGSTVSSVTSALFRMRSDLKKHLEKEGIAL